MSDNNNELRYFFASEKSLNGGGNKHPEVRTDYYIVATDAVGLKFRGGRGLEMKVRTQQKSLGVEAWEKHLIGDNISLENVSIDHLRAVLEPYTTDARLGGPVREAMDAIVADGIHIVATQKQRVQARDSASGICRETTKLVLTRHGKENNGEDQLVCYTYCAEGAKPEHLSRQCGTDKISNGEANSATSNGTENILAPMGYPEFIRHFHRKTHSLNS